ncbi:MAG: glycine--tRNA ligase subunit beta [Nitrospirae bacterium]|nr:MAG: glycine--tRNA ligase subunit beta [Nitrospirota bacterium]
MARHSSSKRIPGKTSSAGLRRKGRSVQRTATLLVEIGTEELPWHMIEPALHQLGYLFGQVLERERLPHGEIQTFGTPRRLSVLVTDLVAGQAPQSQEVWGPPQAVAFDAHGHPTQAAYGFAKSQGVQVADLVVRETPKGRYVCVVKEQPGRRTPELMAEAIPQVILGLTFPKAMKWNDTGIRFARPIRWLVGLYGSTTVRFEVAGVQSGSSTHGHRFLQQTTRKRSDIIKLSTADQYLPSLERAGVIVDQNRRRSLFEAQLRDQAKRVKGFILATNREQLLAQAVYSVEYPAVICGRFDSRYLDLPKEVLVTSMQEHQGFFPLVDRHGALLPRFLAAVNTKPDKTNCIRAGNERVLAARLADAQYFFQEDQKTKLVERVPQLQGIIFHQKLGSLFQKTERMVTLIGILAEACGRGELKETCQRAALLSKADLTTGMVGEFPSLQGTMGQIYAGLDGESESVSQALGEYYSPKTPDDQVPQTEVGQLLALTDRLDTLSAFFQAGLHPSGSEDPFGLRRSAYGLVRILVEKSHLVVNLVDLIAQATQVLHAQGLPPQDDRSDSEKSRARLLEFIMERFRFYGRTVHGLREDVLEAVLASRPAEVCDLSDLFTRVQALHAITQQPDFDPLIVGFKRAHRLVEKEGWMQRQVYPEHFVHESERNLYQGLVAAQQQLTQSMNHRDYGAALQALIKLKPVIDAFFLGVLVNAPEPQLRANRLSLLACVNDLFGQVADFSRIQVHEQ